MNPEINLSSPNMWEKHTCNGKPTQRCAACWAEAYDADPEKCSDNVRALRIADEKAERRTR